EAVPQRGRIGQLIDLYRCEAAGYVSSQYYYWKIYRHAGLGDLSRWVPQREAHQFSRTVAAIVDPALLAALVDKHEFNVFCRTRSLPAIGTLASIAHDMPYGDFEEIYLSLKRD